MLGQLPQAAAAISSSFNSKILTRPMVRTDLGDGYLRASQVAAINLDVDWVILLACNTGRTRLRRRRLSRVWRPFFYAGAEIRCIRSSGQRPRCRSLAWLPA